MKPECAVLAKCGLDFKPGYYFKIYSRAGHVALALFADEVNFAGLAAAGATLLSPFPGEGRPGVKVGLRARAAQ